MTLQEKAAQLQDSAPAIPRLGIPAYTYWNEALHGVARSGEATVFPQAIGMAATWDKSLIHAEGSVISTEARAKYNEAQRQREYGPLLRPRLSGRQTSTSSAIRAGAAARRPRRRPLPHRRARDGVHPRHPGRRPEILPRDRDLEAFRRAQRSGAARHSSTSIRHRRTWPKPIFLRSVVPWSTERSRRSCAPTTPSTARPRARTPCYSNDIARESWGFGGYFVSDCGAIDDISSGHHFAAQQCRKRLPWR